MISLLVYLLLGFYFFLKLRRFSNASRLIIALYFANFSISIFYYLSVTSGLLSELPYILLIFLVGAFAREKDRLKEFFTHFQNHKFIFTWEDCTIALFFLFFLQHFFDISNLAGSGDAYAIWNQHAKYLSVNKWRGILSIENAHPDYPNFVPALNAYFSSIVGRYSTIISYMTGLMTFSFTFLFLGTRESEKKEEMFFALRIAALFLLFSTKVFFDNYTYQYSDTTLGLGLVLALYLIGNKSLFPSNRNYYLWVFLAIFSLPWIKNEGVPMSIILLFFFLIKEIVNLKTLFKSGLIFLPLVGFYIYFKSIVPQNDLSSGFNSERFFIIDRYSEIFSFFENLLINNLSIFLFLFVLLVFSANRFRFYFLAIILSILGIYILVYVNTPYDLNWHLVTSADRLFIQVIPALFYAALGNSDFDLSRFVSLLSKFIVGLFIIIFIGWKYNFEKKLIKNQFIGITSASNQANFDLLKDDKSDEGVNFGRLGLDSMDLNFNGCKRIRELSLNLTAYPRSTYTVRLKDLNKGFEVSRSKDLERDSINFQLNWKTDKLRVYITNQSSWLYINSIRVYESRY